MTNCHAVKAFILINFLAFSPIALSQFDYSVYDGDFNQLPDFSILTPIDTGTSALVSTNVTSQTDTFGLVFHSPKSQSARQATTNSKLHQMMAQDYILTAAWWSTTMVCMRR